MSNHRFTLPRGLRFPASSLLLILSFPVLLQAQTLGRQPLIQKIDSATQRMELIVNSSRILSLDQKIPTAQVNNPDILGMEALSATQVQIYGKKAGYTQVNLFTEDNQVFTVDVIVHPDARELQMLLESQFPNATLQVRPLATSVMISGYVDYPEHASRIIEMAQDYYPKVITNLTVSGVQQVLLKVKVMEVARTDLRTLGIDWANITSGGDYVASSVAGTIARVSQGSVTGAPLTSTARDTFTFGIIGPDNAFFGILEALRENSLLKVISEPKITAISGRPAKMVAGGEVPYQQSAGLGSTSIAFKEFGAVVDFVPIVLGNGLIRLEVRPEISEVDFTLGVNGVPGFTKRSVDTGVELRAGQTLALAGLLQTRSTTVKRGIPFLMDVPYAGALFRRTSNREQETELLIMVTPELIEPLDPCEVPPCGPGEHTTSPDHCELYFKGYVEVPKVGPDGAMPGMMDGEGPYEMGPVPPGEAVPAPNGVRPLPPTQGGPTAQPTSAGSTAIPAVQARMRTATTSTALPNPPQPAPPSSRRGNFARPSDESAEKTSEPRPGFLGTTGYDVKR
ncbi:MAG: pilus assembly protein N-terminal domain-containing protein [Planctomycetes bacterium]|nr:pilus assembly protein N-terminal domain-containing protein [Planctomycetota bacterium]